MQQQPLEGRRILIVEDEYLVAMELEQILGSLGAEVVGPFGRLEPALAVMRHEGVDGAVLDVRLDGAMISEVAAPLIGRGVPIVLTTGYERDQLPPELRALPLVRKPFTEQALRQAVEQMFG
jgi:two-component SAPR family response regulator